MMTAIIKLAPTSGDFAEFMSGLKRDADGTACMFQFPGMDDPDDARVARNGVRALVHEMVTQMASPNYDPRLN